MGFQPVTLRGSNQLSYEATDVGSWSFVSFNEPVRNGCEVICEIFHMLNCVFQSTVQHMKYFTYHFTEYFIKSLFSQLSNEVYLSYPVYIM